jgi:deoxyribonuclease V
VSTVEYIAAVDVHYPEAGGAYAALVLASDDRFAEIAAEHVTYVADVAPYQAGAFYERELPAIQAAMARCDAPPRLLMVDGYVDLDPRGRPGLGAHVHVHAATSIPTIGVAKTSFRTATHALPVLRGGSRRPLYVTAAGLAAVDAARIVREMAGDHRIPDALKRVDTLCRQGSTKDSSAGGMEEPAD